MRRKALVLKEQDLTIGNTSISYEKYQITLSIQKTVKISKCFGFTNDVATQNIIFPRICYKIKTGTVSLVLYVFKNRCERILTYSVKLRQNLEICF